jgi:hypothetical protein
LRLIQGSGLKAAVMCTAFQIPHEKFDHKLECDVDFKLDRSFFFAYNAYEFGQTPTVGV